MAAAAVAVADGAVPAAVCAVAPGARWPRAAATRRHAGASGSFCRPMAPSARRATPRVSVSLGRPQVPASPTSLKVRHHLRRYVRWQRAYSVSRHEEVVCVRLTSQQQHLPAERWAGLGVCSTHGHRLPKGLPARYCDPWRMLQAMATRPRRAANAAAAAAAGSWHR